MLYVKQSKTKFFPSSKYSSRSGRTNTLNAKSMTSSLSSKCRWLFFGFQIFWSSTQTFVQLVRKHLPNSLHNPLRRFSSEERPSYTRPISWRSCGFQWRYVMLLTSIPATQFHFLKRRDTGAVNLACLMAVIGISRRSTTPSLFSGNNFHFQRLTLRSARRCPWCWVCRYDLITASNLIPDCDTPSGIKWRSVA